MSGSRESMQHYYDTRAPEYDDAYTGEGVWTFEDAPGLKQDVPVLLGFAASLPSTTTLDVACGTGFVTEHLRGDVVGLDFSHSMLTVARIKRLHCPLVQGDALRLPFPDRSFERLFSSHFFGRLQPSERTAFMTEARRVARTVVFVDTAVREGEQAEGIEERRLLDGSTFHIYKKYFRPEELAEEMGGAEILLATKWFVAATTTKE